MSNRSDIAAQNMQAYLGGNVGGAEATPSYETPTPTPAADYGSYQGDTNNPYDANNNGLDFGAEEENKNKGQEALEQASTESQKPAQPEQPKETFSQQAVQEVTGGQPDPVASMQRDGIDANTQNKISQAAAMIASGQGTLADLQQNYPSYYNAYMKYYGQPATATPAPAQAPAPTPAPAPAPAQNPILPSAGGNYQADEIYDPSKTYGRQADGSYVYSSSAAQLQRDLNRVMNAGLAVDGYFGEKTQQALDAYLKQNGKQASPASTPTTAETPISQNGSMSAALAASAAEAPAAETSNPSTPTERAPAHDDAWYAEQYERITGNAPRTDILSPERIRDFVDNEMANRPVNPEDEGYDAMLQQQALYEQAQEQQRLNEMNARRDEAFTPKFVNDLRNGKSVEQILGEGDKSYNRWIEENWDDLSYTYNLGSESPFESQPTEQREPINYAAMLDELNQMDRNDWYQRPESQATTQREPINYNAMADELAQLERNDWYQRPESQSASAPERTPINYNAMADELFQADRNDWYQRPVTPQAPERTPLEYSDAFIRQQDMNDAYSPRQTFNDNYQAELERIQNGGIASGDIQASSAPAQTVSSEEQAMRDAYANAMQSAGRARDIFNGLPTEAEQMQQAREQREQNMRTALENQFNNPYMQQFQRDFDQLKQQFPNYSNTALMDMILVNEEMRNGQSSYYKWLANSL